MRRLVFPPDRHIKRGRNLVRLQAVAWSFSIEDPCTPINAGRIPALSSVHKRDRCPALSEFTYTAAVRVSLRVSHVYFNRQRTRVANKTLDRGGNFSTAVIRFFSHVLKIVYLGNKIIVSMPWLAISHFRDIIMTRSIKILFFFRTRNNRLKYLRVKKFTDLSININSNILRQVGRQVCRQGHRPRLQSDCVLGTHHPRQLSASSLNPLINLVKPGVVVDCPLLKPR